MAKYFVGAVLFFAIALPLQAADFNVSNEAQLNAAIANANGNGLDDRIFIDAGTITLTGDLQTIQSNIEFIGASMATTIIDGGNSFRPFRVATTSNIVVEELTIRNCSSTNGGSVLRVASLSATASLSTCTLQNNSAADAGGAIFADGGSNAIAITLNNCTLDGNSTTGVPADDHDGGAIALTGVNVSLSATDCFIDNNTASDDGGALMVDDGARVTILGGRMNGNTAAENGGAIISKNSSSVPTTLLQFFISVMTGDGNTAGISGGFLHQESGVTASSIFGACTFQNNNALTGDGGCFNLIDSGSPSAIFQHAGVIMRFNHAVNGNGGAMMIRGTGSSIIYQLINNSYVENTSINGSSVYINNDTSGDLINFSSCQFLDNVTSGNSATLHRTSNDNTVNVINCTFFQNSDTVGDVGGVKSPTGGSGVMRIVNTLFHDNDSSGVDGADSAHNTLLEDNGMQNIVTEVGTIVGNALFVNETFGLLNIQLGSDAIDAGLTQAQADTFFGAATVTIPILDIDNGVRVDPPDIGAFEFFDVPVVTLTTGTTSFVEGLGPVLVDAGTSVTDADSNIGFARLTITNPLDGADEILEVAPSGPFLATDFDWDANTHMLTILRLATPDQYAAILRTVTYNNTSNDPNETDRLIEFLLSDSTASLSNVANKTVSVTSVNSDPIVTSAGPWVLTAGTITTMVHLGDVSDFDHAAGVLIPTITSNTAVLNFSSLAIDANGKITATVDVTSPALLVSHILVLNVTDPDAGVGTDTFQITVTDQVNFAPAIAITGNAVLSGGGSGSFDVATVSDGEQSNATLFIEVSGGLVPGLSVTASNVGGVISVNVVTGFGLAGGVYPVTLLVTDSGTLTASASFDVLVITQTTRAQKHWDMLD